MLNLTIWGEDEQTLLKIHKQFIRVKLYHGEVIYQTAKPTRKK